jgi:hypothetical protein
MPLDPGVVRHKSPSVGEIGEHPSTVSFRTKDSVSSTLPKKELDTWMSKKKKKKRSWAHEGPRKKKRKKKVGHMKVQEKEKKVGHTKAKKEKND